MTIRDALTKVYQQMQNSHQAQAEDDHGHREDCQALEECSKAAGDANSAKAHGRMAKRFGESANRHRSDAEAYGEMEKVVAALMTSKSMGNDPDAIRPDGVTRIHPPYPGTTAVPRAGQPNPGGSSPPVPIQFEKMFSVEE